MTQYLTKDTNLKVKDIDSKEGVVQLYLNAFGNKDSDSDVMEPGSFKKSIQERGPKSAKPRIKHFKNHSPWEVPGVFKELEEDNFGLLATTQLSKSTLGRDTLIEYEEGIITEHSIGFETLKEEKRDDANHIFEVRLWEGSSLTHWGANSETPVVGIKSLSFNEILLTMQNLEKSLTIGSFSDEYLQRVENQLTKLNEVFKSLKQPEDSTDEPNEQRLVAVLEKFKSQIND